MDSAYHRLARTERYRWWKPLVELLLVAVFLVLLWIVALVPTLALAGTADDGAPGLITLGVSIAVALPATLLAARLARGGWRTLLSVDGRFRGRWFVSCLLIALAQVLASVGASIAFAALGSPLGPTSGAWVGGRQFALLALTVVMVIPLQAAAEEFLFRATLMQALGAWVRPAWFAILSSSLAFGLLHGLPLPGFVSITTFGLVAAWLTVRTGGLEAAIALHVLNNVSLFLLEAAAGRADRWVTEANVHLSWSSTLVDVTLLLFYAAVIAWLHARTGAVARERTVDAVAESPA